MRILIRLDLNTHCILPICNIYLFPVLVLRAGFAFWLLQFLFIAFLLLLYQKAQSQCGFRKDRETIDMIFTARQLPEKCQEQNVDL